MALPRVTSQAWETEDGLRRMDRTQECPTAVLGSGIVTESWERGMVLARVAGTLGLLFLSVQGKERVSILYFFISHSAAAGQQLCTAPPTSGVSWPPAGALGGRVCSCTPSLHGVSGLRQECGSDWGCGEAVPPCTGSTRSAPVQLRVSLSHHRP